MCVYVILEKNHLVSCASSWSIKIIQHIRDKVKLRTGRIANRDSGNRGVGHDVDVRTVYIRDLCIHTVRSPT